MQFYKQEWKLEKREILWKHDAGQRHSTEMRFYKINLMQQMHANVDSYGKGKSLMH